MAWVGKRCNCRDEATGKQLGKNCPQLTQRSHGAWWVRYEAPALPGGKRRRPWDGPYAKKSDADAAAIRLEADAGTGKPVADRAIKVAAYLERWLGDKQSLAASTRQGYAEHIELYLTPGIGHLPLGDLREHHLTELYAAMAQINRPLDGPPSEMLRRLLAVRATASWRKGLHNLKPLSPARIRRVHSTLSSALSTAAKRQMIGHDPSKNIELPTAKKRRPLVWTAERVAQWQRAGGWGDAEAGVPPAPRPGPVMVWTPAQAGEFLDWLEEREDRLYPLWHLVITRGLRRGEVGRLEWADTDLDAKTLSVLEDEDAEAEAGIKSDSSRRVVLLDGENVKLLKAWRRTQREERMARGSRRVESGRVFTTELGEPLDLDYLSERWTRLVRWSGLPPVRLHDGRHCAATLMLSAGVDMKVVSATLGHKQSWFTADVYTSVVPDLAEAAAEAAVAIIPRARKA